jgi:hypothetical protein
LPAGRILGGRSSAGPLHVIRQRREPWQIGRCQKAKKPGAVTIGFRGPAKAAISLVKQRRGDSGVDRELFFGLSYRPAVTLQATRNISDGRDMN